MFPRFLGDSYPITRRVLLKTKTADLFNGVLWDRRGAYLVLRDAVAVLPNGQRKPMEAEIAVPMANVDYLQVFPAED